MFSRYFGVVTMDTMRKGADAFVDFMDTTPHAKIHVIYDNTQQSKGPTNIVEIRRVSKPVFAHPKIGLNVVVTPHPLNKFLTSMLMQAYDIEWRAVTSYNDAIRLLQHHDTTLPPLPSEPPMHVEPVVYIEV
jgi:hypothetical protein